MSVTIHGAGPLRGEITVPGDKSVSHRAVIFGALAEGITEVTGFLDGEDCLSTVACLRGLGVNVDVDGTSVSVHGVGLDGLREPDDVLDAGNSGTTARLLLGVLAGQGFYTVLTGDGSLRRRPMGRVADPLRLMGARILGRGDGKLLPLSVEGGGLCAMQYKSPVASAQVKSAVLLAGLFADGETTVVEPEKSRDHTERMLAAFGAALDVSGNTVRVKGRPVLKGMPVRVPGDISSAAFFIVAASIVPGSDLLIKNVGINPTRTGILDVLAEMGANIEHVNQREESGEPVADLRVRAAELTGVKIGGAVIPRLIDELPVLAVAAAFAKGQTVVRDAEELRVKETDRIAAVEEELGALGAGIVGTADGFIVTGADTLAGGRAKSCGDHRIAMALSVAALRADTPVTVDEPESVAISYPTFFATLRQLGQQCDN